MIGKFFNALLITIGFLVVVVIGAALAARLFGIDLHPYMDWFNYTLSHGRLVNYEVIFENGNDSDLRVCRVERVDTDGDKFKEWLVYYQFDTVGPKNWKQPCPDNSPRSVAIYDTDRGNPAIIFPYNLKAPDRDYLGEHRVALQQHEIVKNIVAGPPTAGVTDAVPELFFFGAGAGTYNQLTIFKYQYNTESWESPTNQNSRYQVIGAFNGSGGVNFDEKTKEVIVRDRGPFERSQLAVKTVYELHGEDGYETYMREFGSSTLRDPIRSTIDFAGRPPVDILNAEYPEKIVLAFYQSLDSGYGRNWDTRNFLADGSQAQKEYDNNNLSYFGLGEGAVSGLAVVALQYFPQVEEYNAASSIEGPQPQHGWVEVAIAAQQSGQSVSSGIIRLEMTVQNGQWKIQERMP